MSDLETIVAQLGEDVARLKAEAAARKVLGRYMFLCDSPLPEAGIPPEARARAIGDLFTPDAIWEGVGGAHGAQFGQHRGPDEIAAHMGRFYAAANPRQIFNTHYLCSEQVWATGPDSAEGQWVQFQPWIYDDGTSLIRSSRLHVRFRETEKGWKIAHYRTENLFIGTLPENWAHTMITQSVLMAG
ncbi:nuclear transport factor 2 family protein [Novosphingobium rosa]|uniref:nuclear transport factor 2 family protein n=1 Tax=Novosphingobium rosa TaxID=76978 RepID=UPI00082FFDE8|nr:nuclear transport factor 2 family protein [Novosphingobium rosa]